MKFSQTLSFHFLLVLSSITTTVLASPFNSNFKAISLITDDDHNGNPGYFKLSGRKSRGDSFKDSNPLHEAHMLQKRDDDGTVSFRLANQQTFYSVDIQVGSNQDEVVVLVDTGSADFWVMNSNNSYCSSTRGRSIDSAAAVGVSSQKRINKSQLRNFNEYISNSGSETSGKNAEVNAANANTDNVNNKDVDQTTVTQIVFPTDPSDSSAANNENPIDNQSNTDTSFLARPTLDCSTYGTFDPTNSDTFHNNNTGFGITYADQTFANGTWGYDNVIINGITISDLSLAVADHTDSSMGVLGISFGSLQTTYSGSGSNYYNAYTYENLPLKLKSAGMINKVTYSIYLNDSSSGNANILFGGVDHSKYAGQLTLLPIVNSLNSYGYSSPTHIEVTLNSVIIGDTRKQHQMEIASGAALALLDTGTTLTYIPDNLLSIIVEVLSLEVNSQTGYYTMDCSAGIDYFLTFNFQGFEIQIPLSSFLLDLTTYSGYRSSTCQLGLMSSGDNGVLLGDSFLRNMYLVVDLEDNVVAMAPANFGSYVEDIDPISGNGGIPSAVSAASYGATRGDDGVTVLSVNRSPRTESLSSYAVAATYGANVDHSSNGTVSGGSSVSGSGGRGSGGGIGFGI
ncbi:unnamed protein product [Ambrosiozyma monospora]|uniref:Unnamed protein product n=1 Tax=Ambrosiozyma monospora TaxID=43982 RepID=A0ACB5T2I2_AMBMO|nr:unnamed protein product [Ambrosiozyma monospora]